LTTVSERLDLPTETMGSVEAPLCGDAVRLDPVCYGAQFGTRKAQTVSRRKRTTSVDSRRRES